MNCKLRSSQTAGTAAGARVASYSTEGGRPAMRVMLDCILSPGQKALLQNNKHIIGLECVTQYKYAPEIKLSYFYMV